MALTLKNTEKVLLTLSPITSSGAVAKVDGAPVWTSSDPVIVLTPSVDGLSAVAVTADNTIGTAVITVVADADLDETGVVNIQASLDIVVINEQASSLGLVAGTPEPK